LNLDHFVSAAAIALNVPEGTAALMVTVGLAESALAAPAAGFGDYEKYPEFVDKVAIMLQRIASNHSLPDGNKRTALICAIAFANLNGWDWIPPEADLDDGKETDEVVRAATAGTVPFPALSAWVALRLKRVR
jgi:death-on-curing protein